MSSSISAARAKVFEYLTTLASPGRQITYGPPAIDSEHEVVALMGVFDPEEEEAELGAGAKWERYDLEIGIKVADPSKDATAAEVDARGFALYDQVRDQIHGRSRGNDRSLGGTLGSGWCSVRTPQTEGVVPIHDGGWVIFFRVLVRCNARVT